MARQMLKNHGITCQFATLAMLFLSKKTWDVIIIDSTCLDDRSDRLSLVSIARIRAKRLFWFDRRDSAGTAQFDVLPFVDRYFKMQLYRDRSLYQQPLYGGRLYTDWYHRRFNIQDVVPYEDVNVSDPGLLDKLAVSWNLGGYFSNIALPYNRLDLVLKSLRARSIVRAAESGSGKGHGQTAQNLIFSCNTQFSRETVGFQRQKLHALLSASGRADVLVDYMPKNQYVRLVRGGNKVISSFGWGEVCFRDFEASFSKCLRLGMDLDCIETWPNIYADGCYLPLKWDFSDLDDKLDLAYRVDPTDMITRSFEVAFSLFTREFSERFVGLVTQ